MIYRVIKQEDISIVFSDFFSLSLSDSPRDYKHVSIRAVVVNGLLAFI